MKNFKPNFRTVPEHLRDIALKYWNENDVMGLLLLVGNTNTLAFIIDNVHWLIDTGKYEEALFNAYVDTRTNWSHWSFNVIKYLFSLADPDKLRAAGDPIPDQDTFTLYRGVAGKGPKRRVSGYSWTSSPNVAAWFATRWTDLLGVGDPAVYEITVPKDYILAACSDRQESEYLVKLPLPVKPRRLKVMPEAKRGDLD